MKPIPVGVCVYNKQSKTWIPGGIVLERINERKYLILRNKRRIYRNRIHLKPDFSTLPEEDLQVVAPVPVVTPEPGPSRQSVQTRTEPPISSVRSRTKRKSTTFIPLESIPEEREEVIAHPQTTRSGRTTKIPIRYGYQ